MRGFKRYRQRNSFHTFVNICLFALASAIRSIVNQNFQIGNGITRMLSAVANEIERLIFRRRLFEIIEGHKQVYAKLRKVNLDEIFASIKV